MPKILPPTLELFIYRVSQKKLTPPILKQIIGGEFSFKIRLFPSESDQLYLVDELPRVSHD